MQKSECSVVRSCESSRKFSKPKLFHKMSNFENVLLREYNTSVGCFMLNMAYGCISNINSLRENKGVKSKREYKMQRDKSNFG